MNPFDRRAAWLILEGRPWSADDLTADGQLSLDPEHAPNGAQNGIGAYVRDLSSRRLIEWTGAVVKSKAPRRKGGAIRLWSGTVRGRAWARGVLADVAETSS